VRVRGRGRGGERERERERGREVKKKGPTVHNQNIVNGIKEAPNNLLKLFSFRSTLHRYF
jgi:hypothetical protein